jgi:ATP-dependent Clp protease protease subunit
MKFKRSTKTFPFPADLVPAALGPAEPLQPRRSAGHAPRAAAGRFFARANAKASTGELYLYDVIGGYWDGIHAKDIVKALDEMGKVSTLNIYINSPGGEVFEAVAIMSVLERFDATKNVFVDGIAASAASFLAMVGDTITTASNGMWMIHEPWGFAMGPASDMRKTADVLDKIRGTMIDIYAKRTGAKAEDLSAWLADETWMTAAEAKDRGFTDEISEEEKATGEDVAAAYADVIAAYKHPPAKYRPPNSPTDARLAAAEAYALRVRAGASPGASKREGQPERERQTTR